MYDDVLVPTDGSATVAQTLEHAIPIAADNDATIHALYVIDTRILQAATDETRTEIETKLEDEGEDAVAAVADRAAEASLETTESVRRGTPSKTILEYADEEDIDLITIGTHGKSAREKQFSMGSVSERVVDDAATPVFVVREA
ncbi:universal stress protein [Natrialbaceae archaeon AArc-T1-2]|uniref:universal stress protein n=1 Tax=Natrialbaceae archaeon AArc-T1-2 TaxID=3053904 RepID=UPI00255A9C83|nr:universal stress protein [Natrialbaceae archaeon AArc-T1-2]WIV66921.1 universal stress protein [Natrialbaceae archaeon AArc-T1-2]